MAEHDLEVSELKARVTELEARPTTSDPDWLKNSNVWKRAEFAASPGWLKFNVIGIALIWGGMLLYAVIGLTR